MKRSNPLLAKMMRNAGASKKPNNSIDLAHLTNLRDSEQYESAVQLLNQEILNVPSNAEAHAHLAHIYMLNNMDEPALDALKKAIALAPQQLTTLQNHARWLIRKNHFSQALGLLNQALTLDPNHIETHELKAHALLSLNELPTALQQINFVLKLQENRLSALALRCTIHLRSGNSQAALNDGIFVVRQKPQWADTWVLVISAYHHLNLNNEALSAAQHACKSNPRHPILINLLGEFLVKMGHFNEATVVLNEATKITPNIAGTWVNLGAAFQNLYQLNDAAKAYDKALAIDPIQPQISQNLGTLALRKKSFDLALTCFERALSHSPNNLELHLNRGLALLGLKDRESEVEELIKLLLSLAPNLYLGHFLLGSLLHKRGQFKQAIIETKKAFDLASQNTTVLLFFSTLLRDNGQLAEAEWMLNLLLRLQPSDLGNHSGLIFLKTYNGQHQPTSILESATQFGNAIKISEKDNAQNLNLTKRTGKNPSKLKVGFVSGDFRNHPVGYFICSVIQALVGKNIELHAYSNNESSDELTERVQACFQSWNDITTKNDDEVQQLIENEGIHILIDLSGHTAFNRLTLFAKKPAPIQATWLGFLATTGLTEIDWLIGDSVATPAEDESHFSEKIWRMPEIYACFTVPENAPAVNELPALSNEYITFGSFNNLTKVTDEVVRVWSRLLLSVPNSRLFLKYSQLDFAETVQTTQTRFAQHGISPDRLILEGSSPRSVLLASYQRIDIALDPFPYGGGTTNYEALYMGIPILNINGDRFLSRVGTSVMHYIGHPEFNAKDENDFIQKGIQLSSDLSKLAETRRHLRKKGLSTSLFNANRFATQLEQAFFEMWQHHLNQLEAQS
jgi:predicted O-linked N-acetylglucosamine transferase (SPINDLY family)